jgi:Fe-S-cluster containining protein
MTISIKRKKMVIEEELKPIPSIFQTQNVDNVEINEQNKENIEIPKKKVLSKFHLPVLNINKKDYWESQSVKDRKHFTNEVAAKTCLGNCCGYEGLSAGCCQLDLEDLEHVLGSVDEEDIKKLLSHLKKTQPGIKREDIVIDKEEGILLGRQFFNDHPVFQHEDSYPMLRLQVFGSRFVCKFLSTKTFMCTVYNHRPQMCKDYYCEFLKKNYLLRTKDKPNTWQKVR